MPGLIPKARYHREPDVMLRDMPWSGCIEWALREAPTGQPLPPDYVEAIRDQLRSRDPQFYPEAQDA